MVKKMMTVLLVSVSLALAGVLSNSASADAATVGAAAQVKSPARPAPATQPSHRAKPVAAAPTTRPAKSVAAEIIAKFRAQQAAKKDQAKVAFIDMDEPVQEAPPEFVLFQDRSITVHSLLDRLEKARRDSDVRAVLVNMAMTGMNLSQAQEIRDELVAIKRAGKKAFVFADSYDTAMYVAASGASDICMLGGGEIEIPGVGLQTTFYRGLFDKLGVKADYVQIGAYKGAEEPYTRTGPSKEVRGELNKILDSLYDQIVDGLAYHRNVNRSDVEDLINGVFMSGTVARSRRFVDHLVDQDGLRDLLKKELGRDIDLIQDYGLAAPEAVDFSNPLALLKSLNEKPQPAGDKPQIALIYAEGVIVDGESDSLFSTSDQIGSENIRQSFRLASRDPNVKAIVLRIDSPGGSAMASEVMWQAVHRAAEKKPVIISVGSMAASGGYYLASAGDYIVADPTAIVGSIGVVGGKFVLKDLMEKVGVHTETFKRGANAALFSMDEPFTESQRRLVTNWMQQTYEQFTRRVLTNRRNKIKDIDDVAHGRIFLAKQAHKLGMVDELGGLNVAIAHAATSAKLPADGFDIRVIPGTRTLSDILRGSSVDAMTPIRSQLAPDLMTLFKGLSPANARVFGQQLEMMRLMQKRPVILMSPFTVTLH